MFFSFLTEDFVFADLDSFREFFDDTSNKEAVRKVNETLSYIKENHLLLNKFRSIHVIALVAF